MRVVLYTLFLSLFLQSCKQDLGNYSYKELNDVIISNIDDSYFLNQYDTLRIDPKIDFVLDNNIDTSNYKFTWYFVKNEGENTLIPDVLAEGRSLKYYVGSRMGVRHYTFRVTDVKTGVFYDKKFTVMTRGDLYEGWYVLSEKSDQSSNLDLLSYQHKTNDYKKITNVLQAYGITTPIAGRPNFIQWSDYLTLGTTSVTAIIYKDANFDFSPSSNILDYNNSPLENTHGAKLYGFGSQRFLAVNNKVYTAFNQYRLISKMSSTGPSFKASKYVAVDEIGAEGILFNEDQKEFVWFGGVSKDYCDQLPEGKLFNFKIGKDLLYMKRIKFGSDAVFALLKDIDSDRVHLARFTINSQEYYRELKGTLLHQADLIEFGDEYGYIFYTVGNKLYSYDFNTDTNKLIADYQNRKISLIQINQLKFFGRTKTERLSKLMNNLVVCTYNESNLDSSGLIDIYSVPALNATPTKIESYDGFGKIVSVAYYNR